MTTSEARRFPVGLTIAAAVGIAILIGLGVWQLQRLEWKQSLLAKIAAREQSQAQPISPVLARAAKGEDVEFVRVVTDCRTEAQPEAFAYGLDAGQVVWRPLAWCVIDARPYERILVDRGIAAAERGLMIPTVIALPAPGRVVGVLRAPQANRTAIGPPSGVPYKVDPLGFIDEGSVRELVEGRNGSARYILAVQQETPAPAGVTPAPLPADIPNNHLAYALTWFGLAGALGGVYAAVLWRRLKA